MDDIETQTIGLLAMLLFYALMLWFLSRKV